MLLAHSRSLFLVLVSTLALSAVACGADTAQDEVGSDESDLLKKTGPTSHWSYRGLLPALVSPEVVVSLKGHTVHVTGFVNPKQGKLPFYVKTEDDAGRTRVHVAYPMATANTKAVLDDGSHARNPEPFAYNVCGGDNFHASNSIGAFGGFPFIEYVCHHRTASGVWDDGIAFHGPITTASAQGATYWSLLRGPVSHGCNRMLGEHVLELAHLIGFDHGARGTKVTVIADFDELDGKIVDVDYPATGWTRPNADDATVFPIWQAVKIDPNGVTRLDFPQWACETSRCPNMPPNARDPYTGAPLP